MEPVTLYGQGAIQVHDDKQTYVPANGKIIVPPTLVAQVLAMGFSRTPPADADPVAETDTLAKIEVPDEVALSVGDELEVPERRADDQDAAVEEAFVEGTLPEEDRRTVDTDREEG